MVEIVILNLLLVAKVDFCLFWLFLAIFSWFENIICVRTLHATLPGGTPEVEDGLVPSKNTHKSNTTRFLLWKFKLFWTLKNTFNLLFSLYGYLSYFFLSFFSPLCFSYYCLIISSVINLNIWCLSYEIVFNFPSLILTILKVSHILLST